jgi:hypothetical protein
MLRIKAGAAEARLLISLLIACAAPSALGLNKCVDEQGRVTYSDTPCVAGSNYQEFSSSLKSAARAGDPANVVLQDFAAIQALDMDRVMGYASRAQREKFERDRKAAKIGAKEYNAAIVGLLKAVQPTNIKIIDVKYSSTSEAVVRQEGTAAKEFGGGRQVGTTRLGKEPDGWKIESVEWAK